MTNPLRKSEKGERWYQALKRAEKRAEGVSVGVNSTGENDE